MYISSTLVTHVVLVLIIFGIIVTFNSFFGGQPNIGLKRLWIHTTHFWETTLSTLAGFIECGNGLTFEWVPLPYMNKKTTDRNVSTTYRGVPGTLLQQQEQ
jgi:uncharacterized membrane protein